jgi:UDP-glucuronate 4-epimerase
MNILLTGAAGFIGSNLSDRLVENNSLTAIDNFDDFYHKSIKENNIAELLKHKNFTFYNQDLLDSEFLNKLFSDTHFDLIIHIAAKAGVRPSIENPQLYINSNVISTLNLLEAAKKHSCNKIIFASSSSVYGNNKNVPFSEIDKTDNPISPYAVSKKSCELLLHSYTYLHGISSICLRLFTVYGRRQRPDLAIAKFTRLINEGNPIPFYGDGSTARDYTYIDDILDGFIKSIDWINKQNKPNFEIVNLGESKTTELSELVSIIESELGKKASLIKLAEQPGDVKLTYADISKAKSMLGYEPKTLINEGIKEYIKYFKQLYD